MNLENMKMVFIKDIVERNYIDMVDKLCPVMKKFPSQIFKTTQFT